MTTIIGQVILEQFRVDAFLAAGGMGTIYRVWDTQRNVHLAMKVLHADLAEDPSIFKRFKREARALEKLAHPNIVPFYGLHQTADFAFLLERYIDGPTLKKILRKHSKPLEAEEALVYLKAITSALGYAHAHGVVHCDVKPGNVIVDQGGSIYLTDFGVARHAESTTTTLGLAGTAVYMAPEQCRGEEVTTQTDVYALGVMLYEMLTGRKPFRGVEEGTEPGGSTSAERVRYAHIHLQPPDPRTINPVLSTSLVNVIQRALAKENDRRYSSVRDLYKAACHAAGVDHERVPDRVAFTEEHAFDRGMGALNREGPVELGRPQGEIQEVSSAILFQTIKQLLANTTGRIMAGVILVLIIITMSYFFNTRDDGDSRLGEPDQPVVILSHTEVKVAQTSLKAPSPTITKTPLASLTPPLSPRMYAFHACRDRCLGSGANATNIFPEKQRKIFLDWRYDNINVGSFYERKWTLNGREWVRYECRWPGPQSGFEENVTLTEPNGLHSGEWELTISIDGVLLLQEQIWVEGDWDYWYPAGTFNSCYGKR